QDIVERVFNIGDRKINSLMTHRKSVVFLQMQDTFQEVKNKVVNEIHSFYPVCQQNMEEVIGIVSLKDIFLMVEKENVDFQSIINEPVFMNEFTSAYHALEIFKSTKNHFALVTDEYGVVQGVLTLNDILEALVGDASEFDEDEYQLTQINDNYWESDGFYPLHDLLTYFDLDEFINQYDVATVSGLVMEELSYIRSDEYGVVQGVLTLNDILEALVGDASEFDEDEYQLTQINDNYWESDGFYPLHDLLTYFDLDEFINQYDVATVSGLVMEELSYIPVNG